MVLADNHRVDELSSSVEGPFRAYHESMARDLCLIASMCDAVGDVERRDVALRLAADLLRGDAGMAS